VINNINIIRVYPEELLKNYNHLGDYEMLSINKSNAKILAFLLTSCSILSLFSSTTVACCFTRYALAPVVNDNCGCAEDPTRAVGTVDLYQKHNCNYPTASGVTECHVSYVQVGSTYGCHLETSYTGYFLCLIGRAAECAGTCAWGLAQCLMDPPQCLVELTDCQSCVEDFDPTGSCGCGAYNVAVNSTPLSPYMDLDVVTNGVSCP
jgi:hypothetical protein